MLDGAGEGIRTLGLLRDKTLDLAPLARLGYPRLRLCEYWWLLLNLASLNNRESLTGKTVH
jgi:hypothetical protein